MSSDRRQLFLSAVERRQGGMASPSGAATTTTDALSTDNTQVTSTAPPSAPAEDDKTTTSAPEQCSTEVEQVPSELDCAVCFKLLLNPVSIACGHTFCRTCLQSALSYRQQCPLCRAPCLISRHAPPVNVLVQTLIEKSYPNAFRQRLQEEQEEREMQRAFESTTPTTIEDPNATSTTAPSTSSSSSSARPVLPLFLLSVFVFPGCSHTFNIFEPRYRLMVARCLEGDRKFGIVHPTLATNREALRSVPPPVSVPDEAHSIVPPQQQRGATTAATTTATTATEEEEESKQPELATNDSMFNQDLPSADPTRMEPSSSASTLRNRRRPAGPLSQDINNNDSPNPEIRVSRIPIHGCVVEIVNVQQTTDGRFVIQVVGRSRFKTDSTWIEPDSGGLHMAEVTYVNDDPTTVTDQTRQLALQVTHALQEHLSRIGSYGTRLLESSVGSRPNPQQNLVGFSLWLTAALRLTDPDRFFLMQTTDTDLRLQRCLDILQLPPGAAVFDLPVPGARFNGVISSILLIAVVIALLFLLPKH